MIALLVVTGISLLVNLFSLVWVITLIKTLNQNQVIILDAVNMATGKVRTRKKG